MATVPQRYRRTDGRVTVAIGLHAYGGGHMRMLLLTLLQKLLKSLLVVILMSILMSLQMLTNLAVFVIAQLHMLY